MNHKAELTLHRFLDQATDGKKVLSDTNIDKICDDIKDRLHGKFGYKITRKNFKIRMNN